MNFLLALVPLPYRILIGVVAFAAVFLSGWVMGLKHDQHRIDAMVSKAATEGVRIVKGRDAVTEKVVLKFVPQLAKAEVVTETIIKEVPVYVPLDSPALPAGWRLLHDAAAAGSIPDPARVADAAPVSAQAAAETVASNYGACRADQIRLQGLQEWVREQGKVK